MSSRRAALALALLVTFLWSTSWVLIKVGLDDLQLAPLSFAGLRYALAAGLLLPLALPGLRAARTRHASRSLLARVGLLGVVLIAVTQGAQFAALVHLPAVSVSLALSTTPVLVALASLRGERPTLGQMLGIIALVVGAGLYFGPVELGAGATVGLAIAAMGVGANASASLLGRSLMRDSLLPLGGVVGVTALSMAVGAAVLLGVGLVLEGLPMLNADGWLIVGWLAVVNTALAFVLWNQTLRTLTAVESSVVNNLMLVQIAVLAWVFLGESLDGRELAGLAIAMAGIVAVQLAGRGQVGAAAQDVPRVSEAAPGTVQSRLMNRLGRSSKPSRR